MMRRLLDRLRNPRGTAVRHRHRQARAAMARGDWQAALDGWRACLEGRADDAHPDWICGEARCLIALQRCDEAEQVLQRLLQRVPRHPPAYALLAELAQRRGDWQEAVLRWRACLEAADGEPDPVWQSALGGALLQQDRLDEAAAILEPLGRRHPDNPAIRVRLALLAQQRLDLPLSERLWRDCVERFDDGSHPQWHAGLARAILEQGRHDEAMEILDRALGRHGDFLHGLAQLAQACFQRGDLERCLDTARRLIAGFPGADSGYAWAERALNGLGRFEEAADYFLRRPGTAARRSPPPRLPAGFPAQLVLPPVIGNGNDYGFIERRLAAPPAMAYRLPVSVVLPVYNRARLLANTLAALVHQSYPADLIEVVVADDGSSDDLERVVEKYRARLDLTHVRQEDRGYRLAAVRNLGVRAARHPYLILLDCDILPSRSLVESYMRVFHVTDRAVLMGLRDFVRADALDDDTILRDPDVLTRLPAAPEGLDIGTLRDANGRLLDYRLPVFLRTRQLKEDRFPFQYLGGGNLALPRAAFESAGGYDERFQAWGGEDTEFAHRLGDLGYYLMPLQAALGHHQESLERSGEHQAPRQQGMTASLPLYRDLFPLHPARDTRDGSHYTVPRVSLIVLPGPEPGCGTASLDRALAQDFTDLEVLVGGDAPWPEGRAGLHRLRRIDYPPGPLGAVLQTAVAASRGMQLGLLHEGDLLEPWAVSAMLQLLERDDVGFVCSPGAGPEAADHSPPCTREGLMTAPPPGGLFMFRKRDWHRCGGCDPTLHGATRHDLALRLSEVSLGGYLPRITCRGAGTRPATTLAETARVVEVALGRLGLDHAWCAEPCADPADACIRLRRRQAHVAGRGGSDSPSCRITGFIAGSGRGGTTWLLESLNHDHTQGILFEPFRKEENRLLQNWRRIQYLRPDDRSTRHLDLARQVLEARTLNGWLADRNPSGIRERMLVKEIRANLCLKWLHERFPEIPYVLLLRHPCAVARSRWRTPWPWPSPRDDYLSQADLVIDHLEGLAPWIETLDDPFESHLVAWCIETLVPLRQLAPGDALVVFYEDLCLHPEREFRRILRWLGQAYSPEILHAAREPSSVARAYSAVRRGTDRIHAWQADLDSGRLKRAMAICRRFGLETLYAGDGMPRLRAADVLGRFG